MKYAIGIDIGGTKIASGIVNENGNIIQEKKVASDPSDRENMFARVVKCVHDLLDQSNITLDAVVGIGAGVPGKVDVDNGIAIFQNNLPWGDFPLAERLQAEFGVKHVTIDNDVYMATYAEWKKAQLSDNELFVYMTISTGISCAIIQGGEFIRGAGFAGELGLLPVVQEADVLHAEEHSVDAFAPAYDAGEGVYKSGMDSGSGEGMQAGDSDSSTDKLRLADDSASHAAKDVEHSENDPVAHGAPSHLDDLHDTGEMTVARLEVVAAGPALEKKANDMYRTVGLSGAELFDRFYKGERTANALIERMADAVAQSVYMVVSVIDPHKIVFGGSVAFHNPQLVDVIKAKLEERLIEEQRHILDGLEVSRMENGQGIIGAGMHAIDAKQIR